MGSGDLLKEITVWGADLEVYSLALSSVLSMSLLLRASSPTPVPPQPLATLPPFSPQHSGLHPKVMNQNGLFLSQTTLSQVFGHAKNSNSTFLLAAAHTEGTPWPQALEAKHHVGEEA